jgi:hypothetical protein
MDVEEKQVVVDDKPVLVEFSKATRSALWPIGGIEAGLRCRAIADRESERQWFAYTGAGFASFF